MSLVATDGTVQTVHVSATVTCVTETADSDGEKTTSMQEVSTDIKAVIEPADSSYVDTLISLEQQRDFQDFDETDAEVTSMEQILMDMVRAGLQPRGPLTTVVVAKKKSNAPTTSSTHTSAITSRSPAPRAATDRMRNNRDAASATRLNSQAIAPTNPTSTSNSPQAASRRS